MMLHRQGAANRFGEYFDSLSSVPGTVIINLVAIFLGIYLVERVGYRVMLIVGAALQLVAMILELSLPAVFAVMGNFPTWMIMALVEYLMSLSGGLNEALAFLLIGTLWSWDPFHAWGRFFAAAPLAIFVFNMLNSATNQNMDLAIGFAFLSAILYAGCVLCLQYQSLDIEVDDAPIVEELSSLLDKKFLFLASLAALTWAACRLDLFSYGQFSLSDSLTSEFINRSVQILGPMFIVTVCLLGYLRTLVSDYDLVLTGAICCLIGTIKLALSDSETEYFRAWLFLTVGAALSKPLLLSWATTWMGNGTRLYIGALLASSATCSAMIRFGLPVFESERSLESFQADCWLSATLAGILCTIYFVIIYRNQEGIIYRFLTNFHWPENKTLSNLLGWSMFGVMTSVATPPVAEDLEQWLGQLILKFVYGYVFGPFWSDFWVVALVANLLAIYISSVVLMRRTAEIPMAQQAFATLFFLSMFTIWLEDWLTLDGVAWNLFTAYFDLSIFFFVEIAATIGWLWAWEKVHTRLNQL